MLELDMAKMSQMQLQIDRGMYEGPLENNMRHGNGKCTWVDGTTYEGNW